jgi:hypothetical protein
MILCTLKLDLYDHIYEHERALFHPDIFLWRAFKKLHEQLESTGLPELGIKCDPQHT